MKKTILAVALLGITFAACTNNKTNNHQNDKEMNTTLNLTQDWDKTFPLSNKVDHKKVTFRNR